MTTSTGGSTTTCRECGAHLLTHSAAWVPDHRDPLGPSGSICGGSSSRRTR